MMKKSYTKICSLLLGLMMTVPASAQDETFSAEGFECKVIEAGVVEITGASAAVGTSLTVPATVEYGGKVYTVAAIGNEAFKATALTEVDLSAATGLKRIGTSAFAECRQLKTVVFPPLATSSLTEIGSLAFHHDTSLSSMNLQDTRIEVLESLFTKNANDEVYFDDLTELALPQTLKEIKSYALQFLGLRSITIPSSVTAFGEGVLEGTIYLEEFYWRGALVNRLPRNTFLGEDALKTVYFLTVDDIEPNGLSDKHFFMCHKNLLNVYVTKRSYDILTAAGYDNEKTVYSTLVSDIDWVIGDADGNGAVNVKDIVEIVNYKSGHPSASFILQSADANLDGVVDDTDISLISTSILTK